MIERLHKFHCFFFLFFSFSQALTPEESESAVVSRKLWSAHLQAATAELFAVVDTLCGTGCQPLQHLMRRVCWQIADLAAPSALRITK